MSRWSEEWRDHDTAHPERVDYAALTHAQGEEGRFAETLRILAEANPAARGLTAAVLVQTNAAAAAMAEYLRREGGLAAVAESDLRVGADNPLTCAILALFRAAAHPGDRAAWGHVRMTPLVQILGENEWESPDALSSRLLGEIHALGFERTVDGWLGRLEAALPPDDLFSRERGRQLAAAARLFDATGSRDVAEFAEFAERYAVRESDTAGVVRVMTIHKAKGLGFDLVILPDLEGKTLAQRDAKKLAVQRAPDRSVEWVLHLPSRDLYGPDPVLSGYVEAAEADACYENFCLLYVAMTRAKRAMVVVTEPVGTSKSPNFPRLLQETLGETWAAGDPSWYEKLPHAEAPAPRQGLVADPNLLAGRAARRRAVRPSATDGGTVDASRLFSLPTDRDRGAPFGTAVHALFAEVEWAGLGEIDTLAAAWSSRGTAGEEALACLRAPELAEIWSRPAQSGGGCTAEVWRERSFEAVRGENWITGTFDRVIVERDAAGRAIRATVFDFKTDRIETGGLAVAATLDRHRPQLELYRQAAALLTGLDPAAVACELVLTALRRRIFL